MPIVSITIENAGWPEDRPDDDALEQHAEQRHRQRSPASTASQNGKPSERHQREAAKAPSIISSPWAKLTVSVAL